MIKEVIKKSAIMFGIEFGNSENFFSSIVNYSDLLKDGPDSARTTYKGDINSRELLIDEQFRFDDQALYRAVNFRPLTDIFVYDLVSRYVVTDESGERPAVINGKMIPHTGSNIYYQEEAGSVRVPIEKDLWLDFSGKQAGMPNQKFEHVFYIRDESKNKLGNRWIVHHRVIANVDSDRLILRGCNPRFEGPVPRWLNDLMPNWLHHYFFRIRERRYPNFPVMTVAENRLQPDECVELETRIVCSN